MVATGAFSHGSNFAGRITATGKHLNPSYLDVGTGVSRHGVRGVHTGPSTCTQDFALAAGHAAPSHNARPAAGCPY